MPTLTQDGSRGWRRAPWAVIAESLKPQKLASLNAFVVMFVCILALLPTEAGAVAWSTPDKLLTINRSPGEPYSSSEYHPSVIADSSGHKHLVYDDGAKIKYLNGKTGATTVLFQSDVAWAGWPTISTDSRDALHVTYWYRPNALIGMFNNVEMHTTNASGTWSTPQLVPDTIAGTPVRVSVVDSRGASHSAQDDSNNGDTFYVMHKVNYVDPVKNYTDVLDSADWPTFPALSLDLSDNPHVAYRKFIPDSGSGPSWEFFYTRAIASPNLYVTIPGINTDGRNMARRAMNMSNRLARAPTIIRICKKRPATAWTGAKLLIDPSAQTIANTIRVATNRALAGGGDIIVHIDMDLERYSWQYPFPEPNRWHVQTRWAGRTANIVARAFKAANPNGARTLYSHSAGGDATRRSLEFASAAPDPKSRKLFDSINIFNGRTNVSKLAAALKTARYNWWETKVFLNKYDYPALPGSLSYYPSAAGKAGKSWITFWGYYVPVTPIPGKGHSYLVNTIGKNVKVKISIGSRVWKDVNDTVEDLMNIAQRQLNFPVGVRD